MKEIDLSSELTHACEAAITRADAPIAVSELRAMLRGSPFVFPAKQEKDVERLLTAGADAAEFHRWPPVARSRKPRFWRESFGSQVGAMLREVLAEAPGTAAQCLERARKRVRRETASVVQDEARKQLRHLVAEGQVLEIAAGRSAVYLSPRWMQRFVPPAANPLETAILEAVAQLESGPGNYVSVGKLRHAAPIKDLLDRASLRLAAAGRLVLGGYDGPRPIPENQRADFIEDGPDRAYVAVARPREQTW